MSKERWDIISPVLMRVSLLFTSTGLALVAFLGALPVRAQEIPGVSLPGVPNASAQAQQSFGNDAAVTPRAAVGVSVDAAGLVGLPDDGTREALSLADVLRIADAEAADLRIAAERVVQSEANLRRAWAGVLPQVNLNGSWQLACTGGGADVLSCADRTTNLVDPDQLEQQANLLEGLAQVFNTAADASNDPEQAADLRAQAAEMQAGADSARDQAKDVEPVVVQPANVFSSTLTIAVPLFNGRAFPLLLNAYEAVDVAGHARDQVKNALLYSTTRAYHGAVAAKKLVGIAERQLESAARHKAATAARVEAQTQPPLSLRRAELEELRAKQQLANARNSYEVSIATLGLVLGREEAFDVVEPSAVAMVSVPGANDLSTLLEQALSARPDVQAQRKALEIARRGELDAWMMFAPSVNLVAAARATSFTQGFVRDPVTGTLSITATLPLYDGGLRYAALKDSASRVREESIRARQLEDRVRAQVRGNARDVAVKQDALALSKESAAVARTAHEQAQAMFDAGVGTALDVSDTALALFVAENDLARAELDLQLARIGFTYVTGAPIYAR